MAYHFIDNAEIDNAGRLARLDRGERQVEVRGSDVKTRATNWAGNVAYTAERLERPGSLEELCDLVRDADRVKAVGSGHSFNDCGDTPGVQVCLDTMPWDVAVDRVAATVSCSAAMTYAELSLSLVKHDLALGNLASLLHISVAGAISTGTHGSGARNPALSAAVSAIELVEASGASREVRRGDADFDAMVVGLGAFGVVHRVTLDLVPAFLVDQRVHLGVAWETLLPVLPELLDSGYSVSLITTLDATRIDQVWVKQRSSEPRAGVVHTLGGREAQVAVNPLPGIAPDNVNEQLGASGPSHERLPHFRSDFQPGRGDEIQSEYFIDSRRAGEAIAAVRGLGTLLRPIMHVCEIRAIAGDPGWLSPSGGRDSVALHFTWKLLPDEVAAALPRLEQALLPLGARPHWAKAFDCGYAELRSAYPRLDEFAALVRARDPQGTFDNSFLRRVLGAR